MLWLILYNLLFPFLFAAFLALAVFHSRGRSWLSEFLNPRSLAERLGLALANPKAEIWIHAASLGEARSLGTFLEIFKKHSPGAGIHFTVMTSAAVDFIKTAYLPKGLAASVSLSPLDFWLFTALYARRMRSARILIVVETELWPNLIAGAKRRGLAVCLVNGRLSVKTMSWMRKFPSLGRLVFGLFDAFCVSEKSYMDLIKEIMGEARNITVTGNLKWDTAVGAGQVALDRLGREELRHRLGIGPLDLLWVAASTREGEEEVLFGTYRNLVSRYNKLRLVVVPRHVERSPEVADLAQEADLKSVLWSRTEDGVELPRTSSPLVGEDAPTRVGAGEGSVSRDPCHPHPALSPQGRGETVVVVNKFGLLNSFYGAADMVFVGGTLVHGIGGHNFLEPAARSCAIVIGPYFENFRDIGNEFLSKGALALAKNSEELQDVIKGWIENDQGRRVIGENAAQLFREHQGATQKTWDAVKEFLG
ncbi:MAG: hypothetical protein HY747_00980 [Elusimicrobia bacterium]|nr:hypothetical protein [Elusimicrobiota bacterium]